MPWRPAEEREREGEVEPCGERTERERDCRVGPAGTVGMRRCGKGGRILYDHESRLCDLKSAKGADRKWRSLIRYDDFIWHDNAEKQ
jgi:hypothetical protein